MTRDALDWRRNGRIFTTDDAVDLYTKRIEEPELFPGERKSFDRYFTRSGASVLDVGCGVGRVSHLLAERGFDVVSIDVSKPLVEKARELFPELDVLVADIRETDFDAESFDYVVFSYFGLDYVLPKNARMESLREIHRLLKPAGVLVFSSHNGWYPFFSPLIGDPVGGAHDLWDLYLSPKNRWKLGSRYRIESVPLGHVEIYLSNPLHQWLQLRRCGFTPIDVVGRRDGVLRLFERDPHYVARK